MCFNSSTGLYSCQLDEQWFNLHQNILRDALNITLTNDNNPFVAPRSSDTVIEYVNTLRYLSKTAGFDRPRHPVLQILWGIIHSSNIDYAERIWEEFVQSIQTFLTNRKNLATASHGKKKTTHLPSIRYVGKDGREIFASDPKPKPVPTQPPKAFPEKKRKLVQDTPDEPLPTKRSKGGRGFAAALAVLVTGASQSRQHGKSEFVSYSLTDIVINVCLVFPCPDALLSSRKHPFVRTRKMIKMTLWKEQIQVFKVTGMQVLEILFNNRVFLEISSSEDNFTQVVIPRIMSVNIELLLIEPPVRDAIL
nr:hypothetical protein [Tanacetum cinerariifolium]